MEAIDLATKVNELNGQLTSMKANIMVAYDAKISIIKMKINQYNNLIDYYIKKGVNWCKNHIRTIKNEIAKILKQINDLKIKVEDWLKKQLKVVEDFIAKQIDKLTIALQSSVKATEDFAKEQVKKSADQYIKLQAKAKIM